MTTLRAIPTARGAFAATFLAAVAALVFVFHGGVSSNPASRALTVLGLVEVGTLSADPWAKLTIDRAIVDGHTYSDKAPLSSFVVLPFYWVWHAVRGRPFDGKIDLEILVLIGDVVAAAIPFAAFVLLLERRAARWISAPEAVLVSLLAAFSTPLLSYGAIYFGHVLGGALIVFAYDAAKRERALLAGALVGLAVLGELPTAIVGAFLGVFLVWRPNGLRLLLRYALGGLPFALALGAYNAAITGSPFDPPYHHLTSIFYTMHPYTLDAHTFVVAWRLLVGQYRGVLFYAPALLVLFPLAVAKTTDRRERLLFVGVVVAQFGFIASFWMWDGGWCIGPRHLAAMIMVILYEGVDALARTRSRAVWVPFFVTALAGLAIDLIAVATNPFAPSEKPFTELYWPALKRGAIAPDNVFRMLGMDLRAWSLLAWCALFALAVVALGKLAARAEAATSSPARE